MKTPDYQNQQFRLWILNRTKKYGVSTYALKTRDRFYGARYRVERTIFAAFVHGIEMHLTRRPHINFEHPKNRARPLIYLSPGVRKWSQYMPGGFATYPVHNPDVRRLHTGARIDYLTRNLFRHSKDGIGLRSRAYVMMWYVVQNTISKKRRLHWLSVAAGTGQPVFDAAAHLRQRPDIILADIDDEALAFARQLAQERGLEKRVTTLHADISESGAFAALIKENSPDVVDMMGLMEYLDDKLVVKLVRTFYMNAPGGSLMIFTNMRATHPELQVHKSGLGWPGVIVRSVQDVVGLIESAGVANNHVDVLLPDDNVYGVYCIKKP